MTATKDTSAPARSGFLPEVQGLRTVALLLVATFHIWFDRVSGGVDVFLLISAYLMTRSLAVRAERGEITNAWRFLVRKFARLMPAAIAAILLTLVAILLLYPQNLWAGFAGDAAASAGYVENFRLQQASVDYFAANDAFTSPFQHFWSLSIQGQVFAIWAVVHLLCDLAARRFGLPIRKLLLAVFATVFVGSLAYSIQLTDSNQTFAYFDTWARLWEFAAGSLLALLHPWVRLPNWARATFSTIGLAGVLSCGLLLPVASSFPGYAALWPVCSAALVILSSGRPDSAGAGRVLAHPVLTRIGDYTYALYLTHWPVLIMALFWWEAPAAGPKLGLFVLGVSAILAILIVHGIEKPLAHWNRERRAGTAGRVQQRTPDARVAREIDRRRVRAPKASRAGATIVRGLITIAASLGLVIASSAAITAHVYLVQQANLEAIANADLSQLGANSTSRDGGEPLQDVTLVKDDWVNPGPRCDEPDPYRTALCYHLVSETEETDRSILNIGNSHSTQLTAALLEVVERNPSWELRTSVAPGCNLESSLRPDANGECVRVWETAERFIQEQRPDLVFVYGTIGLAMEADAEVEGIIDWVARMKESSPSTEIVVIRDNPRLDRSPFDCASTAGYEDPECVAQVLPSDQSAFAAQVDAAGGIWMDLNDRICDDTVCPPVRGNVFVYLDDNHLTETYYRTLAGPLSHRLHSSLDWWPADPYAGEVTDRTPGEDGIQDQLNK